MGRLLIPYLDKGHYFGIEPNRWLVRRGIRHEIGRSIVRIKRPSFLYRDDFKLSAFSREFDFILAQSIFSHTFADLFLHASRQMAAVMTSETKLLATYIREGDGQPADEGSGWLYPEAVAYHWEEIEEILDSVGLVGQQLVWPHHRQKWFIASLTESDGRSRT